MAFCENCGSELRDGAKFCPNCGAGKQAQNVNPNSAGFSDREITRQQIREQYGDPTRAMNIPNPSRPEPAGLDKYGKFIGIGLLAVAIIDFFSDPAIVTILLSMAIIAGAIFCFSKRYKLKVFTIFALILSVICLFCGIYQASKFGLFKLPRDEEYTEAVAEDLEPVVITPKTESKPQTVKNDAAKQDKPKESEPIKENPKPAEEIQSEEPKEAAGGVNPDLKAFLDSYEAFVDEYVAFMKKYMNDPTNALSMIVEYGEIMQKYEDFAKKVDQYNTDEMSVEDAKYYLEVTSRCSQKMLDILN